MLTKILFIFRVLQMSLPGGVQILWQSACYALVDFNEKIICE
jgi:hypothetical protein